MPDFIHFEERRVKIIPNLSYQGAKFIIVKMCYSNTLLQGFITLLRRKMDTPNLNN